MTKANGAKFGVHSEVGQLRKVLVCAPGKAHQRLTPSNSDALLFDDVLWVDAAKRDHFDFINKMRDRGIDVLEMHNLLAETVAIPEAKKWILDNQVVPDCHRCRIRCIRGTPVAGFTTVLPSTLYSGLLVTKNRF